MKNTSSRYFLTNIYIYSDSIKQNETKNYSSGEGSDDATPRYALFPGDMGSRRH